MCGSSASIPAYSKLDISSVLQDAQNQASNNIAGSIGLEQQYAPQLYQAMQAYQGQLGSNIAQLQPLQNYINQGANTISQGIGYSPTNLSLPTLAPSPIQNQVNGLTANLLNNPGGLNQDTSNQILRSSAAQAGQGGLLGSAAANNIAAQNLGLGSLNMFNNNMGFGQAMSAHEQQLALGQQAQQAQLAQNQQELNLANLSRQSQATQQLSALGNPLYSSMNQIGMTPLPQSGLDPGALASLDVAKNNAYNNYAQQYAAGQAQQSGANQQFYGSLASSGIGLAAAAIAL